MRAIRLNGMRSAAFVVLAAGLTLAGCSTESRYTEDASLNDNEVLAAKGSTAPQGQRRQFAAASNAAGNPNGIQVNGFLWRAALDTVSFMPINTSDPYGGAILTDWYSPDGVDNERFKLNVLVQGEQIRSDGVRVRVFKQQRGADGDWVDAEPDTNTALDLENLILSRARDLRQQFQNQ